MKKTMTFILTLLLFLSLFITSCAPTPTETIKTTPDKTSVPQTAKAPETKIITDMAGRQHEVSADIKKVFATNPVGTTLVYTLAPDKLLGWNYQFNEAELMYIGENYQNLPVFGTIKTANYEALISADPDIILSAAGIDEKTAAKIDEFQDQIGIPIIMVDESLLKSEQVYRFLGDLLNEKEQADKLSEYAKTVLDYVNSVQIDESDYKTIYFGNGINSLNTSSRGTPPSEAFDLLNAFNVCAIQGNSPDRIEITAEHLIEWNPDYMFINGEPTENLSGASAAKAILENESYNNLTAVKKGNVINIPKSPFAWMDRPRSTNRLLGLIWAGHLIYPDYYDFNNDMIKEFYHLFYHVDLTDQDIERLFNQ